MVKEIIRDRFFLSLPSSPAAADDEPAARDLEDTLRAHADHCAGMAANMIGVSRRIVAVMTASGILVMRNPVILEKSGPYRAEEGCLSLDGTREADRWQKITVEYDDARGRRKRKTLKDFEAEAAQHEMDHLEGILI